MKLQRFFNALIITLIVLIMLCATEEFRRYDLKIVLLEQIAIEQHNELADINQNYLSRYDVVQPLDDLTILQDKVESLEVEVDEYRQDVLFWNDQTGNYFGKYNTGYFKEAVASINFVAESEV